MGSLKFEELSDIDISHAVPKRLHSLVFTGSKWVAFADPVQQTGWLIDLKISSPFIVTGKNHKLRKVVNSGTRLCSFIPETRNIVLEIVLGDRPDDFVDVLPGLKLKWPQKHANQGVGIHVIVQETPRVQFTLQDIQHEADFCLLNLDKLFISPDSFKRLQFTPGELSSDQTAVIIGQ